jgi:predicted nucleotide-binding protein
MMPKKKITVTKKTQSTTRGRTMRTTVTTASNSGDELRAIAQRLQVLEGSIKKPKYQKIFDAIESATTAVGNAWGGSWVGYESRIYYEGLVTPPPGTYFKSGYSQLNSMMNSSGIWLEYRKGLVEEEIYKRAKNPNLSTIRRLSQNIDESFDKEKENLIAVLRGLASTSTDVYFNTLLGEAEEVKVLSQREFISAFRPKQIVASQLSPATSQGVQTPPHIMVITDLLAMQAPALACGSLAKVARNAYSHIERTQERQRANNAVGTKIFIGHGRSTCWKDLRDFIRDRLYLPWDEFNRVPIAGITNISRLKEMLDDAAFAFVVMTAEDEQADGKIRARMNVIHEAGLFQGRLGFAKAIVLLEDGCEEFSNIAGLGYIHFSKGNISETFEKVREVLEREEVIA